MEESSASVELTNPLKISTSRNTRDISLLVILRNLLLDLQQLFRSHLITALVMKLILQDNYTIQFQRNLRLISLNMSIMIRRSSGIPPNSIQRFQKTSIGDSLYHSIQPMTLSQSSSLHKRIRVSLKGHFWKGGSTRISTTTWSSLLLVTWVSKEISRSMDITSIFLVVMSTQANIWPLTLMNDSR